ncbi:DNA gyrase inhibitor YacG [Mariprofundus ferrooxydans]|uniref:DNA gyrase inhibitor YacG n=1 Tax=Mariprofundus ferrooxydans PV-1 TaxID=314345 RepID=Q0EZC5_9PROT|nr:DNA gyrase inhibitor YacG [Mariprofundus ferrooxydans]EAU54779.1 hypothetical protein SPV1_14384 [Mariprofundus ferrooxydans PV-1]
MSEAKTIRFRCPVCRKETTRDSEDFPFCSSRCRIIDLGRWASDEYSIPGEPVSPHELEPGDDSY